MLSTPLESFIKLTRKEVINMIKPSSLKLEEGISLYEPSKITKWIKESGYDDLLEFVDLENTPFWTNDGATIVIAIKDELFSEVIIATLEVAKLTVAARADEFNYCRTDGRWIVRLWWD
jgi:hypothetical protein